MPDHHHTPPQYTPEDGLHDSLDVFEAEWRTIAQRRYGDEGRSLGGTAPDGLTGLALSGGGIRSATFNLGVLQALSRKGLLGRFDYLSTVSGGGYIGGWWSAWLARQHDAANLFPFEEGQETWRHSVRQSHLDSVARPPRPDAIHHIRQFSNYLTPRKGALSRDLWRAATVVVRNLLLTWTALLPFLAMAVVLAQALFLWGFGTPSGEHVARPDGPALLRAVASLPLAFLAWFAILSGVWLLIQRGGLRGQWLLSVVGILATAVVIAQPLSTGGGSLLAVSVSSTIIAIAFLTVFRLFRGQHHPRHLDQQMLRNRLAQLQTVALIAAIATAVVGTAVGYGPALVEYLFVTVHTGRIEQLSVDLGKYTALLTAIGSALHAALSSAPTGGGDMAAAPRRSTASRLLLRAAPTLTIITLLLSIVWLFHTTVGRLDADIWSPVFQRVALIGAVAMAAFAVTENRHPSTPLALVMAAAVTVLGAAALTVLGLSPALSMAASGTALAVMAAWRLFAAASPRGDEVRLDRSLLLLAAALGLVFGVASVPTVLGAQYVEVRLLIGIFAVLFTTLVLVGWTADPNGLSLHTFYRTRLVRAYIAASSRHRPGTHADDVTETKPDDDVPLARISGGGGVTGPYHLINATLNLTTGSDLVIAQRAAAPFLFSRHFCGSSRTGFRHTNRYRDGTLTLGTAIAISGAAASPIMGSQTPSTAMSMLLAFLNVRLGYWIPTPSDVDWQAPQARLWPFYLLREFFSHVADTGSHCYVTDGGHFDNTGVYALVERGCRTIVVTDCGADPDFVFDDLANLVRRCRIDFGAEITFPSLVPFSRETLAKDRRAYVRGEIRYRPAHLRAVGWPGDTTVSPQTGALFVIKPTLRAVLETDVRRYSQKHGDFPQQSTADQWFDEAQFESYRRLGEESGNEAAEEVAQELRSPTDQGLRGLTRR